ncbi:MAG: NifB/NifX family molybdenum-iron cluster-binding protein [Deltaproteobacteria bacterium]|nr:NifB/NifX family molybdenum-iron cluster-binding protein [Deltaproteobacteria bacterium]MBW2017144.1 NifB/NifX family molybdenum-iron cluster-binding protein [Deltaproteobacteria bacterium]MBW2127922.1 NifB/NifX family molybdenum-iron cluster-binding protein [Deltaproteobacteria bacterium]MBW2304473.1 NifB/NifX family molybdenum-iron cluster-binding protein [Deltaproteobacteria bacterium]
MRIAFPVVSDKGLESPVYGHFGSAPCFVIFDSERDGIETVENRDSHHPHGQCQPLKALGEIPVDAVVVGGIGGGALRRLQAEGIKVYRAVEGDVRTNLEMIQTGKLPEFLSNMTCAGHGNEGGCHHHK